MTTVNETFPVGTPKIAKYTREVTVVNPDLVIGLELETENCNIHDRDSEDYQEIGRKANFNVHTDGSLRGVAYEFISKPMYSKHAVAALGDFLKACEFTDANYTDRCSVHVHVNCTDLTLPQVSAVALLYTVVEDVLFQFVGQSRDSNIYCIPWNQCRNHHALVNKFLTNPGEALRGWNKYTALNILPLSALGTVEFRQMHGTADMGKLTTWINIIGGIFKYARENELKDLTEQIKSLNTTSHYEAFFTQVLSGQLPYNDLYRQKLEEGVILAKYSMISKPATGGFFTARNRLDEGTIRVDPAPTPLGNGVFIDAQGNLTRNNAEAALNRWAAVEAAEPAIARQRAEINQAVTAARDRIINNAQRQAQPPRRPVLRERPVPMPVPDDWLRAARVQENNER